MAPATEGPVPAERSATGSVRVVVRLPTGEPLGGSRIFIKALTPVEVRSIALWTGPSGVIQLGLFPGTYIIGAGKTDDTGRSWYGESPAFVVEARQVTATEIEVGLR